MNGLSEEERVATIAGDIIAKCIAKGTIGGLYVPVDVAAAAFPPADHGLFRRALESIDHFLLWHKNGSCYGLNPKTVGQAYQFALANASPKRAELLAQRGTRTEPEEEAPAKPAMGVTRSELLAELEAYVPEAALRLEVAALRREIQALRESTASLSMDDEAIRKLLETNATKAAKEMVDAVSARLATMENQIRDVKTLAQFIETGSKNLLKMGAAFYNNALKLEGLLEKAGKEGQIVLKGEIIRDGWRPPKKWKKFL